MPVALSPGNAGFPVLRKPLKMVT